MFISILIGSYWIAGLGNQFNTMISIQWIFWTWTGILLNTNMNELDFKGISDKKNDIKKEIKTQTANFRPTPSPLHGTIHRHRNSA